MGRNKWSGRNDSMWETVSEMTDILYQYTRYADKV